MAKAKKNRSRGGVSAEVTGKNSVPFKVDATNKFNVAKLVEVKVELVKRKMKLL